MIRLMALLAGLLLAACNDGDKPPNAGGPASVSCQGWTVQYSRGIPGCIVDGFDFGEPHYIVKRPTVPLHGKTITLHFSLEGSGTLFPTEGDPPARIRLYIQQRGDRLTASEEHKRWWSTENVELVMSGGNVNLGFTLTARVLPGQWTNVFGKNSSDFQSQFNVAVNDAQNVGFTFGGMFAGHGVVAKSGSVKFRVIDFSIN